MEGIGLTKGWWAIAKAEFFVQTAKFRAIRKIATLGVFAFGVFWAMVLIPTIVTGVVNLLGQQTSSILMTTLPGVMRSVILLLWVLVLVYPITYSLRDIKIGQWEIVLSNNVSARSLLLGTFLGKIPTYSLLVLFGAPILLTPFVVIFGVDLIGQTIMYGTLYLLSIATLWLSVVISSAIQGRLGESERGNDLAKALSVLIALVVLLPMYGMIYFAEPLAEVMGLDLFLLLPSSWCADIITWSTLQFRTITVPEIVLQSLFGMLPLPIAVYGILILVFSIIVSLGGVLFADKLFSLGGNVRSERITTIGKENLVLRLLRRTQSGAHGVLLVTMIKEFTRKVQNLSRVVYGIFLSILLPVILNASFVNDLGDPEFVFVMSSLMVSMMLGMICGITFGGIGFIESKDQLWIIRSAPQGVRKYVRARLIQSSFLGIPISIIPSVIVAMLVRIDFIGLLLLIFQAYIIVLGSILFATGITALNPTYENTKSSAFYLNTIITITGVMVIMLISFSYSLALTIISGVTISVILISGFPLLLFGALTVAGGVLRLSNPE